MNEKVLSTVLIVKEDESAKTAVAAELDSADKDIKETLTKGKLREDSKWNVGGGGFGSN